MILQTGVGVIKTTGKSRNERRKGDLTACKSTVTRAGKQQQIARIRTKGS